jgi:predicted PurR-regulated permease PerM
MIEQNNLSRGMRTLISTAAFVIITAGIYFAQPVVVLLLVSIFLALLGTTPLLWLKRKGIPSAIAVLIVMAGMMIVLFLIGAQIVTSISNFSNELPQLQSSIREQALELSVFLRSKGFSGTQKILLDYINPEAVMNFTAGILTGLSSVISDLILILLTVTFILLEVSSFPKKLRAILGDPERVFPRFTNFVVDMKRYMIIKTLINLAAGILIALWMKILGVQFPILWGFLAFLLHYIPNIGAIIAAIPPALMALVQLGMGSALLVSVGNLLIGFIIGNIIEPRLMGRNLGLSTLVVFVSLIFWGSLLGLIGAVLCIPLTMTIKVAFESNESTKWIAVLLGSEKLDEFSSPILNKMKEQ